LTRPRRKPGSAQPPLTRAQSQLVADNVGLAIHLARLFGRNRPEMVEDFDDAAIDGLILAARAYEPARGWKFGTVVSRCVRYAIIARIKYLGRSVRNPGPDIRIVGLHSGDDGVPVEPPWEPRLADGTPDFEGLIARLPVAERAVLRLRYVGGMTYAEIGDELGFSRQRAHQLERLALGRLRR